MLRKHTIIFKATQKMKRGKESLRRNRVVIIVNRRVQNAVLGCNLINDRMISVCKLL